MVAIRAAPRSHLERLAWVRRVFAIDLRSLAAFRVLAACALLLRIWDIWPDAAGFLSDDGVLPRPTFLRVGYGELPTLYLISGEAWFAQTLLALHAIAALVLLVGYRARLAALVCWGLNLSLMWRNPLISTGADPLLGLLLFWAVFLPIGHRFSVDAALRRAEDSPPTHFSIATVGLLLQALYVYFFGALLKTGPEWTTLGSAVYAALHFDAIATHLAHWFRQFHAVTYFLTYYVLWLEFLTPLLLLTPYRTAASRLVALPLLVAMHIGFRLLMDISNFWLVSIASLAAFIPAAAWDLLGPTYWRPEQRRIKIYYDEPCTFCRKMSLLLREFCLPREALVAPAQSRAEIGQLLERQQSWVVEDGQGRRYLHWDALVFVLSQSIALRPLAWLAEFYGRIGLGAPTYRWIGLNRSKLSVGTSFLREGEQRTSRLSPLTTAALVAVLLFCLLWNIRYALGEARVPSPPTQIVSVARALGFTQKWRMFAPYPQLVYAVPIIEGQTRMGAPVDLLSGRMSAPATTWPTYPIDALPSSSWRKYFDRIAFRMSEQRPLLLTAYAGYSCRRWNSKHRPPDQIVGLTITLLLGRTLSRGEADRTGRHVYAFRCVVAD